MKSSWKALFGSVAIAALTGCARTPSVDVFGSFFPVWMFCMAGGILATLIVRAVLKQLRLEDELGPRPIIYPAMAILFTCILWMAGFHD
jgi:hypothetical protein